MHGGMSWSSSSSAPPFWRSTTRTCGTCLPRTLTPSWKCAKRQTRASTCRCAFVCPLTVVGRALGCGGCRDVARTASHPPAPAPQPSHPPPSIAQPPLPVRIHVHQGLQTIVVNSVEEILLLKDEGKRLRHVGKTNMNAQSSRSHSIFTVTVETCEVREDGKGHIRVRAGTPHNPRTHTAATTAPLHRFITQLAFGRRVCRPWWFVPHSHPFPHTPFP